jgi:hypothetical protein
MCEQPYPATPCPDKSILHGHLIPFVDQQELASIEAEHSTATSREAFVRGAFQPPKSRKSQRSFELGAVVVAALNEQWQDTAYKTDTDLVFCHVELGSPLEPSSCLACSSGPR